MAQLPRSIWHDNPHGPPDRSSQVSGVLAEQLRAELANNADDMGAGDNMDDAFGPAVS